MDTIYENLKSFLLNDVNNLLDDDLESITESYVIFGLIDISKYSGAKCLISILPESQKLGTGNTYDTVLQNDILVTIICSNDTFANVQENVVRYTKAFQKALFERIAWPDDIEDVGFNSAEYTFDAGTVSGQASAVEIRLTVNTEIQAD